MCKYAWTRLLVRLGLSAPGAQSTRSDGEEIHKGAPVGERKSWLFTRQRPEGWQVLREGEKFVESRGNGLSRRVRAGAKPEMPAFRQGDAGGMSQIPWPSPVINWAA